MTLKLLAVSAALIGMAVTGAVIPGICDEAARAMLFQLDNTIQSLRKQVGDSDEIVSLTGLYHNLVRRWADA